VIVLEFDGGNFMQSKKGGAGIRCELDPGTKKVRLILPQGTNLVERRVALRQADTIARSGFLLSSGERVGRGWELVVDEKGSALPERVTVSPRISYSNMPKRGEEATTPVVEQKPEPKGKRTRA
jgi:hypothetical protein